MSLGSVDRVATDSTPQTDAMEEFVTQMELNHFLPARAQLCPPTTNRIDMSAHEVQKGVTLRHKVAPRFKSKTAPMLQVKRPQPMKETTGNINLATALLFIGNPRSFSSHLPHEETRKS